MEITDFKKGDIVVRVEACKRFGDRSYLGEKLKLIGICNGCAYFDYKNTYSETTKRIQLSLDVWRDGWEYWKDIDNIKDNENTNYTFKQEIIKALENEDYEYLSDLKQIFDQITNNKI